MARLMRANVIATSGGALEAAADIDVLVLDKTGTITRADRHAVAFQAAPGIAARDLMDVAQLASLADETPEGHSIVALVTQMPDQHPRDLSDTAHTFHEFSAQTRISGVDLEGRRLRKGAADAVRRFAEESGGSWPSAVSELVDGVARSGATPLVVADGPRVLGVIELHDIVKAGIREHCAELRRMGIRTIMVTGDNTPRKRKCHSWRRYSAKAAISLGFRRDQRGDTFSSLHGKGNSLFPRAPRAGSLE
jgi:K+-transporting ATPase ATPase B chain